MQPSLPSERDDPGRGSPWLFGTAIALGAFLLFAFEPLIARYILPWFGGSTEVWTTCMLFFQVTLLLGYLYAHLSSRYLSRRSQVVVHGVVMLAAVAFMPIIPADHWRPTGVSAPVLHILIMLAATAGVPFFAVAATAPLLQSWMSALDRTRNIYRLYALSNTGSLLALLSYPFLIEPWLTRHAQSWAWAGGLLALAALCAVSGMTVWALGRSPAPALAAPPRQDEGRHSRTATPRPSKADRRRARGLDGRGGGDDRWGVAFWALLPAAASAMLLASTNMICLEVAAIPFLWVLPLAVYLATFVLCFAGERWYPRAPFVALAALAIAAVAALHFGWVPRSSIGLQVLIYMAALFTSCMVAHGEAYRLRPAPERLTAFYLAIAGGGALGGFLVAVVAPLVFDAYWELFIAMPLCLGLGLASMQTSTPAGRPRFRLYRAMGYIAAAVAGAFLLATDSGPGWREETLERSRSFYGVLRVVESLVTPSATRSRVQWVVRVLRNGPVNHGVQVFDLLGKERARSGGAGAAPSPLVAQARFTPTSYYGPGTGGGIAMRFRPEGPGKPRRIGVVGLGAGTMALYGERGDTIRFYELNPDVAVAAERFFTFLADARARGVDIEVQLGDGRLLLQREPSRSLDVLAVDAFTGDAVPVHLLTRQAFELYLDRLRTDGVLTLHVTNRYLDLEREVVRAADALGVPVAVIPYRPSQSEPMQVGSEWVVVSQNPHLLADPAVRPFIVNNPAAAPKTSLWTDDFSSVFEVMRPRF